MPQQDVNAFQMLEFEAKFSKVQRLHRECIAHAKTFWQIFHRHNSQKNPQYLALQVMMPYYPKKIHRN